MWALLWDMNGVLVDDEPTQERAWRQTLDAAGISFRPGWWEREFLGRKAPATLERMLPHLSRVQRAELLADKQRRYTQMSAAGLPEVPGTVATIKAARARGLKQALVTSASREEMQLVLDQLHVADQFDALVCSVDVQRGKPDPECFVTGAQRLGVDARQCWVIEDSLAGVQAAHAARMRCVALTTSLDAAALGQADLVVDRLGPELLDRIALDL